MCRTHHHFRLKRCRMWHPAFGSSEPFFNCQNWQSQELLNLKAENLLKQKSQSIDYAHNKIAWLCEDFLDHEAAHSSWNREHKNYWDATCHFSHMDQSNDSTMMKTRDEIGKINLFITSLGTATSNNNRAVRHDYCHHMLRFLAGRTNSPEQYIQPVECKSWTGNP
jgi:hypothetical protein